MRKKAGIVLCIIGAVLIISAIMLVNLPTHQEGRANDNEDITEVTQEGIDEGKNDITTEYQGETKQSTSQARADSNADNTIQSNTKQSAHDINPEVYKWPCGSTFYQDWEESKLIVEFAKNKEYYEQIAEQF